LFIAVAAPRLLMQQRRFHAQTQQLEAALEQERQLEQQLREQQKQSGEQIALLSKQLRELRSPQLNNPIVDVYPRRFTRADERPENEVTVGLGAKTITLLLHSTSRAAYRTYRLKIIDARHRVVWQEKGLVRQTTGEYVISLPSEFLPPGSYSFHVHPPNDSPNPIDSYQIKIATNR
jgi:hypothetical protein